LTVSGRRPFVILTALLALLGGPAPFVPGPARAQKVAPPAGKTPSGTIFDRLQPETMRPVPSPPPRSSPPPSGAAAGDMLWVPGRHVNVPGVEGQVFVPGHWERRLSEHEVHVPPLTGRAPDGRTITWPAGVQPLPAHRQAP
jgi:hypothetical protein